MALCPDRNGVVHIGNRRGKIAIYFDETEAIDLAYMYGPSDMAYDEIMAAVEVAYPETAPKRLSDGP